MYTTSLYSYPHCIHIYILIVFIYTFSLYSCIHPHCIHVYFYIVFIYTSSLYSCIHPHCIHVYILSVFMYTSSFYSCIRPHYIHMYVLIVFMFMSSFCHGYVHNRTCCGKYRTLQELTDLNSLISGFNKLNMYTFTVYMCTANI